ncbi:MAG: hypothetical protein WBX25_27275 [Rhodomicrobium sp.]
MSTLTIPIGGPWRLETIRRLDSEDEPARCELCGRRGLRFAHILFNEQSEQLLLAGHRCARRLRNGHPPPRPARGIWGSVIEMFKR